MRTGRLSSSFGLVRRRAAAIVLCLAAAGGATAVSARPAAPSAAVAPALLAPLRALAASLVGTDQGVYVATADGRVLVAQAAARAVHPASISKIPTSLAALERWGADHRFTTTFATDGRRIGHMLAGDLLVDSDGDPTLVDEDALRIALRLQSLGIERIAGAVRVSGPLLFDWRPDPQGVHLRAALAGRAAPAAWQRVRAQLAAEAHSSAVPLPVGAPAVSFSAAAVPLPASLESPAPTSETAASAGPLFALRSAPLLALLKSLNDYSNNIVAVVADELGGAAVVQAMARERVPLEMRDEITLGDGAGTDPRNRLSPRAAVELLAALDTSLAANHHSLADVLPVAGIDPGTLHDRFKDPALAGRVVGKTGTYGSYGASALVGAIHSAELGTVYFAILNHGVPVPEARRRQDRFVRELIARLHAVQWPYRQAVRSAIDRSELVAVSPHL